MSRVFVIGASGHAKVVLDLFEKQAAHQVVGLLDDFKPASSTLFDYPIAGTVADVVRMATERNADAAFVAIGDNWIRSQIVARVRSLAPHLNFVNAVHPSAQIARGVTIGVGCAIMAGAVINCDSKIGDFSIVNTNSSVDHDNRLGEFASLAPRAATGGNVLIGDFSAIGMGAVILQGRHIGQHSVIGAGAVVTRDVPDFTVAYGIPAKPVRSRNAGDKYLS